MIRRARSRPEGFRLFHKRRARFRPVLHGAGGLTVRGALQLAAIVTALASRPSPALSNSRGSYGAELTARRALGSLARRCRLGCFKGAPAEGRPGAPLRPPSAAPPVRSGALISFHPLRAATSASPRCRNLPLARGGTLAWSACLLTRLIYLLRCSGGGLGAVGDWCPLHISQDLYKGQTCSRSSRSSLAQRCRLKCLSARRDCASHRWHDRWRLAPVCCGAQRICFGQTSLAWARSCERAWPSSS